MTTETVLYMLTGAAVIYLLRVLPLTLLRKPIRNRYIRSFLYYVPYATLSVMTFPAVLGATGSVISATAGFAVALLISWFDGNLFRVAAGACFTVLGVEIILQLL